MSIEIRQLSFSYFAEGRPILASLSGTFQRDKVTVLTGPSGCGKSTLLYLIAGLYPKNAGILKEGSVKVEDVFFAGGEGAVPDASKRSALVGMMFQNPDLQFCMDTVRNELIFCLENRQEDPDKIPERIRDSLAFCGLENYEDRLLTTLSGGEKQMVALACVYAMRPSWLLLDEPFANIDEASAEAIRERLRILNRKEGVGILAVEHRLDHFATLADEIVLLSDGQLKDPLDGRSPDAERLRKAGVTVPGEAYPKPSFPPRKDGEVVLSLSGLSLAFEKTKILQDITAQFRRGSVYAILGASGSGKSSLFGALFGLYPYTGEVRFNGLELKKNRKKLAGRIGFVTQSPQDQFIGGTVKDEVSAAFRKDADAERKCEDLLRGVQLWKYRDVSPYTLSQGQQRRLGVTALLAYPCEVLICDEPTYAQDRKNTIAIMESLCGKAREHGLALIFSTHDKEAAKAYADEILLLEKGSLRAYDQSVL